MWRRLQQLEVLARPRDASGAQAFWDSLPPERERALFDLLARNSKGGQLVERAEDMAELRLWLAEMQAFEARQIR